MKRVKKNADYLLENLIEIHPVETYPLTKEYYEWMKHPPEAVFTCPKCGVRVKMAILTFGEMFPENVFCPFCKTKMIKEE